MHACLKSMECTKCVANLRPYLVIFCHVCTQHLCLVLIIPSFVFECTFEMIKTTQRSFVFPNSQQACDNKGDMASVGLVRELEEEPRTRWWWECLLTAMLIYHFTHWNTLTLIKKNREKGRLRERTGWGVNILFFIPLTFPQNQQ